MIVWLTFFKMYSASNCWYAGFKQTCVKNEPKRDVVRQLSATYNMDPVYCSNGPARAASFPQCTLLTLNFYL